MGKRWMVRTVRSYASLSGSNSCRVLSLGDCSAGKVRLDSESTGVG